MKKHITEVADWSRTYDLPELPFRLHKFLFCEKRARDAPKTETRPCYSVWYAQGFAGEPGYLQFADADRIRLGDFQIPGFASPPNGIANWIIASCRWRKPNSCPGKKSTDPWGRRWK